MRLRYKTIIALLAAAPFLGSCEGFLDEEPIEVQTELSITSINDVETVLIGGYNSLAEAAGDYLFRNMEIPELMSDNLFNTPSTGGGSLTEFANFQFTVTSAGLTATWQDGYITINRANFTLEQLEQFRGEDTALEAQIEGEALALRAMAHFDLLKNFGTSLDRDFDEAHSGVPVILTSEVTYPERASVKQVYDQVFADLDKAITLLQGAPADNVYRFNVNSVRALASRVALYAGDYAAVVTYADPVIKSAALATPTDFLQTWIANTDADVLLKVFAQEGTVFFSGYFNNEFASIKKRPSPELFNLYEDGDIRKEAYISQDADLGEIVVKFKDDGNESRSIEVIRMGEIYLNLAEAYLRTNNSGRALELVNALRTSRGVAEWTALTEATLLEERRRELAFEGQRFYDLKRLGLDLDRSAMADQPKVEVVTLPAGDRRWIYPIPRREIVVNPNLQQSAVWE
ncbi:RagB/SusD family nutrient uptake outer membrane protein [Algivirga pacifica]|uniref:RagB/SusD family nutrient uptake outer membrane protein n=1 Tax=Algivirga pacifica TaxID=1162670 RepID=A0ABP9D9I7_9BACT